MYMRSLKFNCYSKNIKSIYNFQKTSFAVAQNVVDYKSNENPRVFFNIAKDGKSLGNLTFEVDYKIFYKIK